MVFSSITFLFAFLPITFIVYLLAPRSLRIVWLLLASALFYAWSAPKYLALMGAAIFVSYVFGLCIGYSKSVTARKIFLTVGVCANVSLLAYFKYVNFFIDSVSALWQSFGGGKMSYPQVLLPVGISFFVFQLISYLVDLYRKQIQVEKNPLILGFCTAFFPHQIAGPIIRFYDFQPQIKDNQIRLDDILAGAARFTLGLSKKVLIANPLGEVADKVFVSSLVTTGQISTEAAWIGALAYFFQIYFDFSGYSDMAIGLGRMFGYRFLENFNYPYIAHSVTEFWRRWHISLSSWFRDYLYIPLGGNRASKWRTYVNLYVVFILCGLWHGAGWTFIAWGFIHGSFLVAERIFPVTKLPKLVAYGYTFIAVLFSWVLFRSHTLSEAWSYYKIMLGFSAVNPDLTGEQLLNSLTISTFIIATIASTPLARVLWQKLTGFIDNRALRHEDVMQLHGLSRGQETSVITIQYAWGVLALAVCSILYLLCVIRLSASAYNPFIYFRF